MPAIRNIPVRSATSTPFSSPLPPLTPSQVPATPPPVHVQLNAVGGGQVVEHDQARAQFAADTKSAPGANFRWGGKFYFLTYSQIGDAPNEAVTNFFNGLGDKIDKWGAVEEHHGDGGRHWHVLVMFKSPFRSRGPAALDIAGIHPHIQTAKVDPANLNRIWQYMHKEEGAPYFGTWEHTPFDLSKFFIFFCLSNMLTISLGEEPKAKPGAAWWAILKQAKSRDEAWALIEHHGPGTARDLVINYDRIKTFINAKWPVEKEAFKPRFTEFSNVPRIMSDWWAIEAQKPDRPKSLVIISESRYGKTAWARHLGRHTYICGMWNVDDLDVDCDYIVFDDIDYDWFAGMYKSFLGAQVSFLFFLFVKHVDSQFP